MAITIKTTNVAEELTVSSATFVQYFYPVCRADLERDTYAGLLTGNVGAEGVETDVYVLVAAVYLVDVADNAGSLC